MIQPQRIGRFLQVDGSGHVQPDVAIHLVGDRWKPLVDFVVHALMKRKDIHSVYLRGSIPRGLAIENVSDADFIYISERSFDQEDAVLEEAAKVEFPFLQTLKLFRLDRTELGRIHLPQRRPYFHMLLKTQGLFLAGNDITNEIESFKLGPDMISHVFWLATEFDKTVALTSKVSSGVNECQKTIVRRSAGQWISKRIVRSGLEITIDREKRFTRDLHLCYDAFAALYPQRSAQMYRVLINSLNGSDNLIQYKDLVTFLTAESARLHGLDRP
jgi:uncharacterized protein